MGAFLPGWQGKSRHGIESSGFQDKERHFHNAKLAKSDMDHKKPSKIMGLQPTPAQSRGRSTTFARA
jgi:hypothetical protein